MRLLQVDEHGKLRLTDDLVQTPGRKFPDYAVLSHTWLNEDQEVTFDNVTNGTGTDKAGYRKLRFCAQKAAQDGLHLFWVDTCCIKRTNSVEVQRSINSMFAYYRNATKCYVYLADVSTSQPDWQHVFRISRWFTRGWTLQELLAPRDVEFFSNEGHLLGCKHDAEMQKMIHEITNIPVGAIAGMALNTFGTELRIQWTWNRETKLPEDKAYSLLGIFGLYMPVLYGEGQENALNRLRRYIAHSYEVTQENDHGLQSSERVRTKNIESVMWETCEYIFKDATFQAWRNAPRGLLLISSEAGMGKSVLMDFLADHIPSHDTELVVSHRIRYEVPDSSATGVIRALVLSLVGKRVAAHPTPATRLDRHRTATTQVQSLETSQETLIDILAEECASQATTILIDGADEMVDLKETASLITCLAELTRRPELQRSQLRVCISSRPTAHSESIPTILIDAEKIRDSIDFITQQWSAAVSRASRIQPVV